jgi:hypothetical protein
MGIVGEFPNLNQPNRRTIRGPVNPMDKTTIVSIYPQEIIETKPTLQPGRFVIPPGSIEKPSITVVGPSSWWREIDPDQPLLEIPVSSVQIADSIIKDYCNGLLGCDMAGAQPGFFYVPGEHNLESVRKNFNHEFDGAVQRQRNWYSNLIRLADSLWARSNGNPLSISDLMRLAAKELGLEKDWLKDFKFSDTTARCKACGSIRNPLFPVCPTCKAIDDPAKAKALGITFAQ